MEAERSAACNCGGNHSAIVGFDGPGNGHAVTCPVRTAATPSPREFSIAVKRLHGIHEWVTSGIAETLDKPGGAFLLGVESEAIIDALDYIEGYIYNLEDELGR